jgi:DNA processing protein
LQDQAPRSEKIPAEALPHSRSAQLDWLQLHRSRRVGPATFIRLLREHGSAGAALDALPAIAAKAGARDYTPAPRRMIEAEWQAAEAAGARPMMLCAGDYPAMLANIADAPPFLWAIGDPELAQRRCIALVGARNASALGCRMAARLARELGGASFAVVSGLARGIDTAAHKAALPTGTIAVQAGGVDDIYPAENAALAGEIAVSGLRLSEMPIGHKPRPQDFPRRNRIVSGLALGVVVVEGALRSGSLITARTALDQGREVMAVPGSPMDGRAGGCNVLIREGATLVRSGADILEALGQTAGPPVVIAPAPALAPKPAPVAVAAVVQTAGGDAEGRILSLLGPTPVAEDILIRETGQPAPAVAAMLLDLELAGRICRHPGGLISRTGA